MTPAARGAEPSAAGPATAPPVILALDDPVGLEPVGSELVRRYGSDYTVLLEESADVALQHLRDLAEQDRDVALVLAGQRVDGESLLQAAHQLHPHARRALLLGWGEVRAAREHVVQFLNRGGADYVIVRPMSSPDERFHRAVIEFLDEWWRHRGTPFEVVRIIGETDSAWVHEICDLLQRHDITYGAYSARSEQGRRMLDAAGIEADRLPVVLLHDGRALIDPDLVETAEALGARTRPGDGVYDLAIVGGGPAGLAAAVYAGSEGLRTALIERRSMGGQAGTSSLIRNYLGFPRGISGAELATRASDQAILFGTEMVYGGEVVGLRADGDLRVLELASGGEVTARAVVLAAGVDYRRLDVPELEAFHGTGVFYGAAMSEARALSGERVLVLGGGNSAGQAALHLAGFAEQVTVAVRSDSLASSMSDYLVQDLAAAPNISVRYGVEVVGGTGGAGRLQSVVLRDRHTGEEQVLPAAAMFVLIGAHPRTDWLPPDIARDSGGYVITGPSCGCGTCASDGTAARSLFETAMAGVFAVGDVRHASIKRVASAAGEGAVCVRLVHEYLETPALPRPRSGASIPAAR